jgi:hypothetical protein
VAGEINELAAMAPQAARGLSEKLRKRLHYQSYLAREERRRYDDE